MLSARYPIVIYRALICLKETSSQDKEGRISYVFQAFSTHHAGQVMIRHPKGENTISKLFHSLLTIPRYTVPVTFAKINCRSGLAKDFTSLQDFHTRSYEESLFQKMQQMTDFDGNRFTIKVRLLAARENVVHDDWVAK